MTAEEIYAAYCEWEPRPVKLPLNAFFGAHELGDVTIKRTKTEEINRLYRVVAAHAEGDLHLFIFYADTLSRVINDLGDMEATGDATYGLWEIL